MKLFLAFGERGYHSTFATTFAIDFTALEQIALPRLRDAQSNNLVFVCDQDMLARTLEEPGGAPRHAGVRYTLVGARVTGAFHPKVVLQLGTKGARMWVASANLTAAGLAGNLEVVGQIRCDAATPGAAPLIAAALAWLRDFVPPHSIAASQFDWARQRTPWLAAVQPATEARNEAGHVETALVWPTPGQGIGERFAELVGVRPERLVVVSPYWGDDLAGLRTLRDGLGGPPVHVLIDPHNGLFPANSLRAEDDVRIGSLVDHSGVRSGRFVHAKVFIAQTPDADHVLYGSPNCTIAALGAGTFSGTNEEIALYRRLPAGSVIEALGLAGALEESRCLSWESIPPFDPGPALDQGQYEHSDPGRFELRGSTLYWYRSPGFVGRTVQLKCFDSLNQPIEAGLVYVHSIQAADYFDLRGERPRFVRAIWEGGESALAVVIDEQAVHAAQRRSRSSKAANATKRFDEGDAPEDLWVLEDLKAIITAEQQEAASDTRTGTTGTDSPKQTEKGEEPRELPYTEFIKERAKHLASGSRGASSLGSRHVESVRTYLNRMLKLWAPPPKSDTETDKPDAGVLHRGDETDDAGGLIEGGGRVTSTPADTAPRNKPEPPKPRDKSSLEHARVSALDTQRQVIKAVDSLIERLRDPKNVDGVSSLDMLWLRSLLHVILSLGSPCRDILATRAVDSALARYVLPAEGETGWPRLAGRLLHEFFRRHGGQRQPLVLSLKFMTGPTGALPDDLRESLVTCCWVAHAVRFARDDTGKAIDPPARSAELARDVCALSPMGAREATDPYGEQIWAALDMRFGARLKISTTSARADYVREMQQLEALGRQLGRPEGSIRDVPHAS